MERRRASVVDDRAGTRDRGRARAAPRRPDAGDPRLRSPRARAPELRLARVPGGPRRCRSSPRASTSPFPPSTTSSATTRRRSRRSISAASFSPSPASRSRPTARASATSACSRIRRADAVPPFKHTSMNAIFRAVRSGDPEPLLPAEPPAPAEGHRLLREHRLRPQGAALAHPQPHRFRRHRGLSTATTSEQPERVDAVLRDYWALLNFGWRYTATGSSDSHRIQYHWAGLPAHDGHRRSARRDPTAKASRSIRSRSSPTSARGTPRSRAARSSSSSSAARTPATSVDTTRGAASPATCASARRRGST